MGKQTDKNKILLDEILFLYYFLSNLYEKKMNKRERKEKERKEEMNFFFQYDRILILSIS